MSLDKAYTAIESGEIDLARDLLRPLMKENNVEAFYLASRVAYTQEQALEFLRHALKLAPDNDTVRQTLHELETVYQSQTAIVSAQQTPETAISIKEKLDKTAGIFLKRGWQLVEDDDDMIHLTRRRSTSASNAFILSLFFHIPGMLIALWSVFSSEKIHIFIEADAEGILISSNKTERVISKPQQAILIVESIRGITFRQAIMWSLLGVICSTIGWYALYWYSTNAIQNFEEQMQIWYTTPTHPPI